MFVEEYLQDVRRERFAPSALGRYARRVAARVRESVIANPGAVRSIWIVALGFFAAAFVAAVPMAIQYDRRLAYDFFLETALIGVVPAFAFVTAAVDLLRDRQGYRLSAINLPIGLTLLRVALVPGIALFLLDRHFVLALVAFVLAALTDVADGWFARRFGQETRLGIVLDPIVDIVFNLAVFFALAAAHLLPTWVFAIAAVRYAILLVGGAGLYLFVGPLTIRPTLFGRLTGVLLAALVGLVLVLHAVGGTMSASLMPITEVALGVLLATTVVQVVLLGWYNLRLMTGAAAAIPPGRVVGDVRWGAP
jgi:cardiolipin synthase